MFLLTSHDLDICKVVILGVSNMYLVNQSMEIHPPHLYGTIDKSSVLLVISDNDLFQYLNYDYILAQIFIKFERLFLSTSASP
jgi:hypothetical protein